MEGSQCGVNGERCFQGDCKFGYVRNAIAQNSPYLGSSLPINRRALSTRRWNRNRTGIRPRLRPIRTGNGKTGITRRGSISEGDPVKGRSIDGGSKKMKNNNNQNIDHKNEKMIKKEEMDVVDKKLTENSFLQTIGKGIKSLAESAKNFFTSIFS